MKSSANGRFEMPSWPVRVDCSPPRLLTLPTLGGHNQQILSEWLAIGAAEVEALRRDEMT